jgi:trimeric autotransporter adhesin
MAESLKMSSKREFQFFLLLTTLLALVIAVSCTGFFVNPTLTSITVGPNNVNLTQGNKQQMTATGTFDDGSTKTLTSGVVWSTSDTSIAPISSSGQITAASAGSATITAQSGTVSGTASINVTLGNVTNLKVNPTTATISSTQTQLFNALATIQGQSSTVDVSSTATWTSSPTGIVSINNSSQTGALVSVTGTISTTTVVTITATYNSNGTNFISTAQLTITP